MSDADIRETLSARPFEATLERLTAAITQAGLILLNLIDHQAGEHEAGWEFPPTTLLTCGHPKDGAPIMLGR
jgi:uncharacterized protein (DUF302 family)